MSESENIWLIPLGQSPTGMELLEASNRLKLSDHKSLRAIALVLRSIGAYLERQIHLSRLILSLESAGMDLGRIEVGPTIHFEDEERLIEIAGRLESAGPIAGQVAMALHGTALFLQGLAGVPDIAMTFKASARNLRGILRVKEREGED